MRAPQACFHVLRASIEKVDSDDIIGSDAIPGRVSRYSSQPDRRGLLAKQCNNLFKWCSGRIQPLIQLLFKSLSLPVECKLARAF